MSRPKGFTLIELLVVVAIIALLASILVPALEGARRQAQLVGCSSNLHQIGVGLAIYLSEWGEYPPPCSVSVHILYTKEFGLDQWDNRQAMVDIVDGTAKNIYFCPLYQAFGPEDSPTINEFSDHFYVNDLGIGLDRHYVGYNLLFLIRDYGGFVFDWSYSGNPGGERPLPGDANSAIVSDVNWGTSLDWQQPAISGHTMDNWWGPRTLVDFQDSNCLYGDGHVVTRRFLQYRVVRNGSTWLGY